MDIAGNTPAITAHRGWHKDGLPQNSIAALERAVEGGVDKVELDVRRLLDGTLVVHHDATFPDGRRLGDVDRSVLAEYPHVPTLDAWAKRAGQLNATALVELKESGYEDEVVATVRRHIPDHKLEYFSFKPAAVRALSRIVGDRPLGLLSDLKEPAKTGAELVSAGRRNGANLLGLNVRQACDGVLWHTSFARMGAYVWTVNGDPELRRLIADPRVTNVISDVPDLALKIRNARSLLDDAASTLLRAASTIR